MWRIVLLWGAIGIALAQTQQPIKRCLAWESLSETQRQLIEALEPIIEAKIQEYQNDPTARHNWTVWRVPVIFHVLYRNNTERPSTTQIIQQLDVLNQSFRGLIANGGNTPPEFLSLVGDARIEFVFAQIDPWGNPTSGINWVNTTPPNGVCFNTGPNSWEERSSATGGVDPWDPNRYLNIWIANLCGGVLGIATFPGDNTSPPGVSIDYTTLPGGIPPFNLGFTAVHEVGHYLGLRHIWGDVYDVSTNQYLCGDDKVGDTPPQQGPTSNCPGHPAAGGCGVPKMFQNFMDYSDDACLTMFTQGQVARMRAFIETVPDRWNLVHSDAGNGGATYDLMISDILYPVLHIPVYIFTPTIEVMNLGSANVNAFDIDVYLDGIFLYTFSWTGNLASGATTTFSLNSVTVTDGPHQLQFIIRHPQDGYAENDTAVVRFSAPISCGFASDFETDTLPNAIWDVINPDFEANNGTVGNQMNALTWHRNVRTFITGSNGAATFSAYLQGYYYAGADVTGNNPPGPQADTLESPYIDLTNASPTIALTFDVAYAPYDNTSCEDLEVYISADQGATWTQLYQKSCNTLATTAAQTTEFYPNAANQWRTETINLDAYAGQIIILRFVGISRWGNNLYIDNVAVNTSSCLLSLDKPQLNAYADKEQRLHILWNIPQEVDSIQLQILVPQQQTWQTLWYGGYEANNKVYFPLSKEGVYYLRLYTLSDAAPHWQLAATYAYPYFPQNTDIVRIYQQQEQLMVESLYEDTPLHTFYLFTIEGKQIAKTSIQGLYQYHYDLNALTPGVYIAKVTTTKGTAHNKMLIIY